MLTATGVSKTFFGNKVLDSFEIEVAAGEVHALIGHNGSGKSTFAKILAGFHAPDDDDGAWAIGVNGRALKPKNPVSTRELGIRFVHQELGMIHHLTILENMRLGTGGYRTRTGGRIDWSGERHRCRQQLAAVGLTLDPELRFDRLTRVQQSEVAIARAIQDVDRARILVLDEPTAALPDAEVHKLYGVIERVRALGIGVVYVSHRLDEVMHLADAVTVLRNGRIVGSGPAAGFTKTDLVELIVGDGRHGSGAERTAAAAVDGSEPALSFAGVVSAEIAELSFSVHPGEVVGVAGLVGSGVHEIPRLLSGQVRPDGGEIFVAGKHYRSRSPHAARARGLVVLSSHRHEKLIQEMTVKENLTLTSLRRYWRRGRFQFRAERREARRLVERFRIKCESIEKPTRTLSGGNQQKVAVARSLQSNPRILALDEPTQGVDVGGKSEIITLLQDAAARGLAVLVCSSDLEELEGLCSRILVVRSGRIVAELTGADITQERILSDCYGS